MKTRFAITLFLMLALPCGMVAFAQAPEEARGSVQIGVRQILGNRDAAKFLEYRDIPRGLYLQKFDLNLNSLLDDRYFLGYQARETLEKDQSHLLNGGMYGKFRIQLRWDQAPHTFTDQAKLFYADAGNGYYTIPSFIKTGLQAAPTTVATYLQSAKPLRVGLRRDTASGRFTYTPTGNWIIDLNYANERQSGTRPFGTSVYFTYVLEQPEPIRYRTHLANASAEYGKDNWVVKFGYSGSIFKNEISTLKWDNPFRAEDIVDRPAQGQLDLYPDNTAHSFNFMGAVDLPGSTRLMGNIVRTWMRQNDAFLPFTTNTAVENVPELPGSSLDGKKQTLAMNYRVVNRAIPKVALTGRYRSYDYDNDSRSFIFPAYVASDAHISTIARRNLPFSFDRKLAGWDAVWKLRDGYSLKLSYDWEQYDREFRDVGRSIEHIGFASFDVNAAKWLLLRTSYKRSERDPHEYEINEESFPLGEGANALHPLEGLMRFDQAYRAQDRADSSVQINPTDRLSFSGAFSTTQNNYKKSHYGRLKDFSYNYTVDANCQIHRDFTWFAEYAREHNKFSQLSRQRNPPTSTAAANDTTNNDWAAQSRDINDTWSTGFDGSLMDGKVTFQSFYSLSAAKGEIRTRALGTSAIPGFLVTTASNYPDTNNRFHSVSAIMRVHTKSGFTPKLEYGFEKYSRMDFQIAPMSPYMAWLDSSMGTSVFLGANIPGYKVHILAISLEYSF